MSNCLLLVHWPDLAAADACSALRYSPPLVAQRLYRQLCLRYEKHSGYVGGISGGSSSPGSVFERWGFRLLEGEPGPDLFRLLAGEHPAAGDVVLAMESGRAARLIPPACELGRRVEVWSPEEDVSSLARPLLAGETLHLFPLVEVLNVRTAHTVGLFIDWNHLQPALTAAGAADGPAAIERLVRCAELAGTVTAARLYGAWGAVELAGIDPSLSAPRSEPGSAGSAGSELLGRELWQLLDDLHAPETWIVVSDADWLPDLIREAHGRGTRVLVWPFSEEQLPTRVRLQADGCVSIGPLLSTVWAGVSAPESGSWLGGLLQQADARQAAPAETSRPRSRRAAAARPAGESPPQPAAHPGDPVPTGARLGPWVRLAYHTECVVRRNLGRIPYHRLSALLAEAEEFGPTSANALMWLNRARAEGMLHVDEELRPESAVRVTMCRLNLEHPASRIAVEIPERVLKLLCQMLQKMPWVSFTLLRNVLLREQWLGGAPYHLDETAVDEWLNFLIRDGALSMSKEPNAENPDYPVTALRLNPEHPLSGAIIAEAVQGSRLAAERAILAVDHFMRRNRKPWMAMSALRRSLDNIAREELHEVLQGLQKLGALVTESYPNPQKQHFTTGCRLNVKEPVVADALAIRDAIIQVTQDIQRFRSWVPLAQVDEELARRRLVTAPPSHRLAWFTLLRDEGLIELDHDGTLPPDGWGCIRCRLNVADAVVRAVVAETRTTEAGAAEPALPQPQPEADPPIPGPALDPDAIFGSLPRYAE